MANANVARAVRVALVTATAMSAGLYGPTGLAQQQAALEEVVVTGSRIARPDLESVSPVSVISAAAIADAGITDVGDLIQSIPSMSGSPIGTTTNNGGNGGVYIDLRGMGSDRTITLINGKRSVDAGDYQTIPANIIERVEVLKGGASAVYGADAVSGVVNIITRTDFDGLEVSAQRADWDKTKAGAQDALSLFAGHTFDNGGHLVFGLEYVDQEAALQSDTPWDFMQNSYYIYPEGCEKHPAKPYDGTPEGGCYPLGSSRIPEGRLQTAAEFQRFYSDSTPRLYDWYNGAFNRVGGSSTGAVDPNFDPAYGVPTYNQTEVLMHVAGDPGLTPYDGRTYNYAPVNYIQTPYRRTNLWLDGSFPLTETIDFSASMRANYRQSKQQLAPQPYDSNSDPGYSGTYNPIDPLTGLGLRQEQSPDANGDLTWHYTADQNAGQLVFLPFNGISADNYYNPTGLDIINARRRMVEIPRTFTQDVTQVQTNFGFKGENYGIKWDTYYNFGYRSRVDHDYGQFSGAEVANAFGPSADLNGDGTPECYSNINDPSTLIVGCVPFNMFGGPNTVTQDMLDYVGANLTDTYVNKQHEAVLNLSGDWFDLPGGKMGWAAGYAYTKESLEYSPDSMKQKGTVTGNKGAGTTGTLEANSVYGELYAPLFDNGSQKLSLSASARFDDYKQFDSQTTYAIGADFTAIESLKLRASYNTVFRAPTIYDLYGGVVDDFPQYTDPCVPPAGESLPAGCAQTGVQTDSQVLAKVGGNPNLQPETGDTWSIGAVWTPDFGVGNFSATVDYWEISLKDAISSLGVQYILDDCYINQNADACSLVTRRPDYSVQQVVDASLNVAKQGAKGIDTEVHYGWDTNVGRWDAAVLWAHMLERTKTAYPGASQEDLSGRYTDPTAQDGGAYPADKINYSLKWYWHDLLIGYEGEYISSLDADTFCNCGAGNNPDGTYTQKIDSQLYHDILVSYDFGQGTKLSGGVTNVTNEPPPFIEIGFNATSDPSTYRMFGRGYFLRLTHTFK